MVITNAMAMAEENGAKPPVVNAADSGAGAGKGPVLGGHANGGRRWKKHDVLDRSLATRTED
jgi:hypothetical protein